MRFIPILLAIASASVAWAETISIDANADRHAINPMVYGVAWADAAQLAGLNPPSNRWGGNHTSRYNWKINGYNAGSDWYFQSLASGDGGAAQSGSADLFIDRSKAVGAQPLITIPIVDWVAKLGSSRGKLSSYSIAKYGAQDDADWSWMPDAGNGRQGGVWISTNDPNDANVASDVTFQRDWISYLVGKYGNAGGNGVRYYLLDNEHSLWRETHHDIHPAGSSMDEVWTRMSAHAAAIKTVDPLARIVGPEEWGIAGCLISGRDQAGGNWTAGPDRTSHGNQDYLPWLLTQFKNYETAHGVRLLDIATTHCYPNGGEFSNDTSAAMQARRNQSTRSLWDPSYFDGSWLGNVWPALKIQLIPRLRQWVNTYYPGTQIGITEYNWGAEAHINGATTLADIWGIFGRENLDIGSYWSCPAVNTPTFKAMQLYRNYDGAKSTFGDTSVRASVTNPDNLSSFAAVRTSDGALTIMVINKIATATSCTINLANFPAGAAAQVYQLTAANTINHLADLSVAANALTLSAPAQSITLLIIPPSSSAPALQVGSNAVTVAEGGTATFTVRLSAAPAANVTVTASRSAGDADLAVSSGASLTFTPVTWNTAQTVTLAAAEDADSANGTATITVASTGLTSQTITATEADNDTQALVVSAANVSVNEGGTATFTVRLSAAPAANVTVTASRTAGDADITVSGGASLTFTTATWNTAQTVTLAAAEDADSANGTATITIASTGLTSQTVTATEADNDTQALVVSAANVSVNEGGTATFTVRLAAAPAADVAVTSSRTAGDTDITVSGGPSLSFTTATWNTAQTVTLAAAEDADTANGTATITVASAGLTSQTVTATEVDQGAIGGGGAGTDSSGKSGGSKCGNGGMLGCLLLMALLLGLRRQGSSQSG